MSDDDNQLKLLMYVVLVVLLFVILLLVMMVVMVVNQRLLFGKVNSVEKNQGWLMITSPERVDLWSERTRNDPAPTPRPKSLNQKAAQHYGYSVGNLKCAVTGLVGSGQRKVIVAHILRRNNPELVFNFFGLNAAEDRDGMRNVIPLCKGLEEAFDSKKISFYPDPADGDDSGYRMKVWEDGVRKKLIWREAGKDYTLGEFERDHRLVFPGGKAPYTRILAYHHRVCYYNAKMNGWVSEGDEPPVKYGSPFGKGGVPEVINIHDKLDDHHFEAAKLSPSNSIAMSQSLHDEEEKKNN